MESYAFDDALTGAHVVCRYPNATADIVPAAGRRSAESVFFPGCSFINYLMPLIKPVADLLEQAGAIDGMSLLCCGKILSYEPDGASVRAAFEEQFRTHVKASGVKRFVAACPNCVKALRDLLALDPDTAGIEVVPLSRVLVDAGYRIDAQIAQGVAERALGFADIPWEAIKPDVAAECDGCELRGECCPQPVGKVLGTSELERD